MAKTASAATPSRCSTPSATTPGCPWTSPLPTTTGSPLTGCAGKPACACRCPAFADRADDAVAQAPGRRDADGVHQPAGGAVSATQPHATGRACCRSRAVRPARGRTATACQLCSSHAERRHRLRWQFGWFQETIPRVASSTPQRREGTSIQQHPAAQRPIPGEGMSERGKLRQTHVPAGASVKSAGTPIGATRKFRTGGHTPMT